ncbi:hypothetical protein OGAPHI_005699 [Ogataea philodendri]|uniref:Survival protein SurE-like phosphatase/nucleotidase domain-containing protein n=1 Tax=Ogataea philodendri TaxID=1378263 RepID=A0A9P8NZI8_9ASCO|nr:uncharacterized protein OGAPHI_005699 [Ogataea philodendri]KAH3662447.1 hypothetical protein OGAPHI_005699 [Ogataea philodendri]
MHVLLTNDDGAPHDTASPYVKYLVEAIEKHTNWDLTICVPSMQKSWIGKAHFAGKTITASYVYSAINKPEDNSFHGPFGSPNPDYANNPEYKEWCLLDGTPATCADIGVNYIAKKPVDLVISGPNVGRNSSALYSLSSGTIGGAMEGFQHGKKSIAISYAYDTESASTPDRLTEASLIAVKLVEKLLSVWDKRIDLYTVNIPLTEELKLGSTKCVFAPLLENKWTRSLYTPSSHTEQKESQDIVDQTVTQGQTFQWTPDFNSVHKNLGPEDVLTDARALKKGYISVTGLRAAFETVPELNSGEIDLK